MIEALIRRLTPTSALASKVRCMVSVSASPKLNKTIRLTRAACLTAVVALFAGATLNSQEAISKPPEKPPVISAAKDGSPPNDSAARSAMPKGPLAKTKADVAELSALAEQLRNELQKTNVNVLSLNILQKSEAIEKLAKKIKGEAGGL